MVQLTSDLLNGLAEKMFKLYEEKGDWDAIDTIFKFMLVSSRCRDSVLRQFSKMEEIEFWTAPKAWFQRKGSKENPYPMPFEVKSCFVRYLIEYGQLRVKRITFQSGVEEMCSRDALPAEQLKYMRAIDVLSESLGFEDEDYLFSHCQQSDLVLDSVKVCFGSECNSRLADLNRFIALKPKELNIHLYWCEIPYGTTETEPKSFCCPRIETVRVTREYMTDADAASWCNFLRYLSVSCPKLRLLDVQITLGGWYFYSWEELANRIETAVCALRDEVLPTLANTLAVNSMVNFDVCGGMLHEINELLASDHPLLRLGNIQRTRNPTALSCSLEVERQEGAPWQISFRIEALDESDDGGGGGSDESDGDHDSEDGDDDAEARREGDLRPS